MESNYEKVIFRKTLFQKTDNRILEFCSRLYKKERKSCFDILDISKITDSKAFFEKHLADSEEKIIFDYTLVSEGLSNFLQNAATTLYIYDNPYIVDSSSSIIDTADKAINTYKNDPVILLIKQKLENVDHFLLKEVSISETEKELRELNPNKATRFGNIPTKILKRSSKSCCDTWQKLSNDA